jgi:DNA (cytosine-5)-methyltransferase 1
MTTIRIADFFSGVGGIGKGFTQAHKNLSIVYSNDNDKYCKKTSDFNYCHKMTLEDISKIDENKLPDFDIFCGGFPCQPFSLAGNKKGFKDKRSNVFYDIVKILKCKKPICIFLENVKNLETHDKGKTFQIIKDELENIGYKLHYQVLNSCEYGNVPQNRERLYIVGFLSHSVSFSFPQKIKLTKKVSDCFEDNVDDKFYYNSDSAIYEKLAEEVTKENIVYQYRRYYVRENKSNLCPTLTANMGTGGHNVPIIKDIKGIRKLTPRECFNIQGFDNNFKIPSDVSCAQLYKQSGNSVSVPVIKRIAICIYEALMSIEAEE